MAALLIAPATLFFLAALGRRLQPEVHEPARTLGAIADAFLALPSDIGMFLVMVAPLLAVALSAWLVGRTLLTDEPVREDLRTLWRAALPVLRHPTFLVALLVLATGLASTLFLVGHAIAG